MVIWSEFRMGQYRDDDLREDPLYNDSPDFDSTAGRCCDISISESERAIDGSKLDSDWSQRSAAEVVLARLNRRRF